jgi:3-deoxy-D-manno-octulosonate 8-phosphate phosphatase (KDO 8-P phosphatase)
MRTMFSVLLAVFFFSLPLSAAPLSVDQFTKEAQKMKMIIVDAEGVLANDQRIISTKEGETIILSARDKEAIKEAVKAGVYIVIVSKCKLDTLVKWAKEAGASYIYTDKKTKQGLLLDLHFKTFVSEKNMAYISADANSLDDMKACGLIICPKDADSACKAKANFISDRNGGEGVLAEVVHYVID